MTVCKFGDKFCFNTQPPEGGWPIRNPTLKQKTRFNTQPPEGGWDVFLIFQTGWLVSTHSRLKAAG